MMSPAFAAARRALVLLLVVVCVPAGASVDALAPFRAVDSAIVARVLALDPDRISAADVRDTLARVPAPHIIALSGSVAFVTMQPFAEFLAEMGYPRERLVNPRDGSMSWSSYVDSERLAGEIAWFYERDAMMPMLIGHSQGGMVALKALHELAGTFGHELRVWAPQDDTPQPRTTIVDPLTGRERPVVGVSVAYASAVGAGGLALVLPGWWESLDTLRKIPDTVDEFTGYFIEVDLIALSIPGNPLDRRYENGGKAHVRNMTLPATYNHVVVPLTASLADDPAVRDWINAYVPDQPADTSTLPASAADHVLWAADVWYSIKKHWCLEAQQWVRVQRARVATESTPH